MRDIEKEIAEWRRGMRETSKHRPQALDELEAHLREEIARLEQAGTQAEKAFELAVAKLGPPAAVGAEFEKLEAMRGAKWKPATLAQWACIGMSVLVAASLLPRVGHGRMTLLLASHAVALTIGYLTMFILGGLAVSYVLVDLFQKTTSTQRYALRRASLQLATVAMTLTAIGIVLGMFWAKENWGRYWAWDPKETGAAAILGCAVAIAALRWFRSTSHNAIPVAGIIGSMGTAVAWFGGNASMRFGPLLIAFIAGHCVVLVVFSLAWSRRRQLLH